MIKAKLNSHWPALLLIPAVLSLFWPTLLDPSLVLFPSFSPFSDVMVIHWPKAHLLAQSWSAGEGLPHWTPLILSGMPLAANQLAMLSYPLAWLLLFFPSEPVFNWLFIFHLVWGGLGVYLLLREGFRVSSIAALLGGLTFALNGKILAHTAGGHVSMIAALGWLPWTVWGVQMVVGKVQRSRGAGEQGSRFWLFLGSWSGVKGGILVAVSLGMQIVTHTLPVIYSVYLLGTMVIWQVVAQGGEEARRRGGEKRTVQQGSRGAGEQGRNVHVSCFTFHASRITHYASRFIHALTLLLPGLLLAVLLGAAQLLPLLELAGYSNRSLNLDQAGEFALSLSQLLAGLLLPVGQAGHEYVIYAGLIPLLLAAFGLSRHNRWAVFYGLVFGFAVLFALGPHNPLHTLFYYAAPGFRYIRTPARLFFVGTLALAVLVGFGADRLVQQSWSAPAKKWLTRLIVALAPLALLVGLGLVFSLAAVPAGQDKGTADIQRSALALAVFIPLGLSLILLRAQRVISAPITVGLLGVLLFADLCWFDSSLLRFTPLEQALSPGRAAAEYLAHKPGYFRVYSPSYSLPMSTAAAAGLTLADGVEPVHLAAYDQFMARAGGYNDPSFSVTIPKFGSGPLETSLRTVQPDLKLLGLLNVTYLAAAFPMTWPGLTLETELDGTYIYRNELALPRAWVTYQTVPAKADWLDQLVALPDASNEVLVEGAVQNGQLSTVNSQLSTVEISGYSADHIELETEIAQPGWLVLSEIWYPGWQATVNGTPQPVTKVNGLLRGVYLSQPRKYQVSLTYRPESVRWGNWISLISAGFLLVVAGGVLLAGKRKKEL